MKDSVTYVVRFYTPHVACILLHILVPLVLKGKIHLIRSGKDAQFSCVILENCISGYYDIVYLFILSGKLCETQFSDKTFQGDFETCLLRFNKPFDLVLPSYNVYPRASLGTPFLLFFICEQIGMLCE